MKSRCIACLALASSALVAVMPATAQSVEQPWLVRLRAVNLSPANNDSTGLRLGIDSKVILDLNATYFWTPNIATELVVTNPQKQKITSNGTQIGSLHHLPPVLSMQYHLTDFGAFKPYAGVGVNYTHFTNVSFAPAVDAALHPSIEKSSVGPSFQIGFDYTVAPHVVLNFDVKKVRMRVDVKSSGTRVGELAVDPWLVGAGVGWRF